MQGLIMYYSKSESVEEATFRRIRDDIISKQLPFGSKISETKLAEQYGVSRTPLRGALKQLANCGLVVIEHNRGVRIFQPNIEELCQLVDARYLLEGEAVKLAVNTIQKDWLSHFRSLLAEEAQCYIEQDIDRYINVNVRLHMYIASASNNDFYIKYINELMIKTSAYMRFFDTVTFQTTSLKDSISVRQHQAFFLALKEGRSDEAIAQWQQHVRRSFDSIIHTIQSQSNQS